MFAVAPTTNLYSLDVTIVDETTAFDDIARALEAKATFVPHTLRDWLANPWPRALIVSGRRATETLRANIPTNNLYVTSVYAMLGMSGTFQPPPQTQVVNLQSPTLSDIATFWNGLMIHLTNRQRQWLLVVSVGDDPARDPCNNP